MLNYELLIFLIDDIISFLESLKLDLSIKDNYEVPCYILFKPFFQKKSQNV